MHNVQSAPSQLVEHPTGGYRFRPGSAPYSCGVISSPGFEIVHVTFRQAPPVRDGFNRIAAYLAAEGRTKTALCAISLRSPSPFTFQGFTNFNAEYAATLRSWNVFVNDMNPIARTNVAPVIAPPSEPVLYGFCFTRPCPPDYAPTFVVAGAGELPEGVLSREGIVALGDTSAIGLTAKAQFVMELLENRLRGLGVDWPAVSSVNVYTSHYVATPWPEFVARRVGALGRQGVCWHFSRPPVAEIEYEMDVRGTRVELRLD